MLSSPDGPPLAVYYLHLPNFLPQIPALLAYLLPAEQHRASRYAHAADHDRFVLGRAMLRHLLGQRLQLPAAAVPLQFNAFGKPQLAASAPIEFNVTHSGDWVLLAIGENPVGLDVEEVKNGFDFTEIAAAHFSPAEQQQLRLSTDPLMAFYTTWTAHEACAKAAGYGLAQPTDPTAWTLCPLSLPPGYAAALAYPAGWQPVVSHIRLDASFFA